MDVDGEGILRVEVPDADGAEARFADAGVEFNAVAVLVVAEIDEVAVAESGEAVLPGAAPQVFGAAAGDVPVEAVVAATTVGDRSVPDFAGCRELIVAATALDPGAAALAGEDVGAVVADKHVGTLRPVDDLDVAEAVDLLALHHPAQASGVGRHRDLHAHRLIAVDQRVLAGTAIVVVVAIRSVRCVVEVVVSTAAEDTLVAGAADERVEVASFARGVDRQGRGSPATSLLEPVFSIWAGG